MEPNEIVIFGGIFLLAALIIFYIFSGIQIEEQGAATDWFSSARRKDQSPISPKSQEIQTIGFDETILNADIAVINFRIQAQGKDEKSSRISFLKTISDIEQKCNEREIPCQIIPKTTDPYIFVQNLAINNNPFAAPGMPTFQSDPAMQPSDNKNKVYFVTQDFILRLSLNKSPPVPLLVESLSSGGVMIADITFPISSARKQGAERSSLLKAIADAKSKAQFLANAHNCHLGDIVEIVPVEIKVEEIRDPNLEILVNQFTSPSDTVNQNPYTANVPQMFMPNQHGALLNNNGVSAIDPIKAFGSALVPKRTRILTQVKVKYLCPQKDLK